MINENAVSISEDLSKMKSVYSNDDIDWVKYVNDHYQELFSTAQYVSLDKSTVYWQHYRLEDFLRDQDCDPNIGWMVLMLNQLSSSMDFKDLDSILLPNPDTLRGLRQSFMQYRSHIKSCRN